MDNISAWHEYGVWIGRGGYDALLAFPTLKEPEANDWPEEDGIEADLSAPRLEAKEASVPFIASRPGMDVNNFIAFLSRPGYRALSLPAIGWTWNVRLLSEPAHREYGRLTAFSLRFAQDTPSVPPEAGPLPGLTVRRSLYEIDGKPLSDYGVVVLSARDGVLRSPEAKKNLSRQIRAVNGQIYDAGHLVFQGKEVTFKCCLKAVAMENFRQCYNAFFGHLIKPGQRELYVEYLDETYPFYYKSTSGWKLHLARSFVMAEFSFTVVFTSFRVEETHFLLASEDGKYITLEQDHEMYIDTRYYGD